MHQGDEFYAGLRGPGDNMTVLATACLTLPTKVRGATSRY